MREKERIQIHLKNILSKERYEHSLRVAAMAKELANIYGVYDEKIEIAGLLHDCAKELPLNVLKELVSFNNGFNSECVEFSEILHAFAGATFAQKEFNIKDDEILNGIRYHTVGRKDINIFEKIIYLADTIEPGKKYNNVDRIRETAFKDIDLAIIFETENKIKYLLRMKKCIHTNTIKMRNRLLEITSVS